MNIKCEFCGLSINPVANTHNCSSAKVPLVKCNGTCEDIGSISTCEKHTYFLASELNQLSEEIADVIQIQPLGNFENLLKV